EPAARTPPGRQPPVLTRPPRPPLSQDLLNFFLASATHLSLASPFRDSQRSLAAAYCASDVSLAASARSLAAAAEFAPFCAAVRSALAWLLAAVCAAFASFLQTSLALPCMSSHFCLATS